MRSRAQPSGKLVCIRDVARVCGDEPGLVERTSAVLLGASPEPGDVRTIARNQVKARLHQEGLSLADVSVCGEEWVAVVSRAPRRIGRADDAAPEIAPADELVRAIRADVAQELGCREDSVEVELLSLQWLKRPPQTEGLEFAVARRTGGSSMGRARYVLDALDGRHTVGRAIAWTEVVRYRKAVALRRLVRPAEIVKAEDLVLIQAPVRDPRTVLVSDPEEVAGREAARLIRPGEPLVPGAVRARTLVEAGEIVTVLVETDYCKIADQARARRSGARGQIIPVENLRSRKTYLARVIDEQMVAAVP